MVVKLQVRHRAARLAFEAELSCAGGRLAFGPSDLDYTCSCTGHNCTRTVCACTRSRVVRSIARACCRCHRDDVCARPPVSARRVGCVARIAVAFSMFDACHVSKTWEGTAGRNLRFILQTSRMVLAVAPRAGQPGRRGEPSGKTARCTCSHALTVQRRGNGKLYTNNS